MQNMYTIRILYRDENHKLINGTKRKEKYRIGIRIMN